MKIYKIIYSILGFVFIFLGSSYILSSFTGITGFVVSEEISFGNKGIVGMFYLAFGFFLLSRTKYRRKGQAAMEFLMTYGWAILAAIVVISVLVYLGVFSNSFGSNLLLFSPPLKSGAILLSNPGSTSQIDLFFEVTNSGGKTITLNSAYFESQDIPTGVTCSTTQLNTVLRSGESTQIGISCNGDPDVFNRVKANLIVTYTVSGSSLTQYSSGSLILNGVSGSAPIVGGGSGDKIPPVINLVSLGGDSSSPYDTSDNTPDVIVNTDESAGCRYSLTDMDYNSMKDPCSSSDGISHTCKLKTLPEGNNNAYVACIDINGNFNSVVDNLDVTFLIDTLPPVQSNHNFEILNLPSCDYRITFNTNENAECRTDTNDIGFESMQFGGEIGGAPSGVPPCLGSGTTNQDCYGNAPSCATQGFIFSTGCKSITPANPQQNIDTSTTNRDFAF
jgi:hypothetical protein